MRKLPKGLFIYLTPDNQEIVVSTIDYWLDSTTKTYSNLKVNEVSLESYHKLIEKFYKEYGDDVTLENITPRD